MLLPEYVKIKDKYLLCYFGHESKYIEQFKYLRPLIEKELPGVKLFISFSDQFCTQDYIPRSILSKKERKKYAYVRDLKSDNPVQTFLKESDLCYLTNKLPECLIYNNVSWP